MDRKLVLLLGLLLIGAGIALTALVISAEIGIPLAIAGIGMLGVAGA
jgi:hypothetical protein